MRKEGGGRREEEGGRREEGGEKREREEGGRRVDNQTWFKSAWNSLAFSWGHLGSASSLSMWSARRWSAR